MKVNQWKIILIGASSVHSVTEQWRGFNNPFLLSFSGLGKLWLFRWQENLNTYHRSTNKVVVVTLCRFHSKSFDTTLYVSINGFLSIPYKHPKHYLKALSKHFLWIVKLRSRSRLGEGQVKVRSGGSDLDLSYTIFLVFTCRLLLPAKRLQLHQGGYSISSKMTKNSQLKRQKSVEIFLSLTLMGVKLVLLAYSLRTSDGALNT